MALLALTVSRERHEKEPPSIGAFRSIKVNVMCSDDRTAVGTQAYLDLPEVPQVLSLQHESNSIESVRGKRRSANEGKI